MKINEAVGVLDNVIPEPYDNMVDREHLEISLAWRAIKRALAELKIRAGRNDLTLSRAFKLCGIADERIYLRACKEDELHRSTCHGIWSGRAIELLDMKRITVVGIEPHFETYGPDYLGMLFIVKGIDEKGLSKVCLKAAMK